MKTKSRWQNRAEEIRFRCRSYERRNDKLIRCTEDRRDLTHEHVWHGTPFGQQ